MDRSNIEKIARTTEEKMLLSKLWDKIQTGVRRDIPASTGFLSPSEQHSSKIPLWGPAGLYASGLCRCGAENADFSAGISGRNLLVQ